MRLTQQSLLLFVLLFMSALTCALDDKNPWHQHPFYIGPELGYGSTNWGMLVINCDPKDSMCRKELLSISAPVSANDTGFLWGATIGYEIKPQWALETTFTDFALARIYFDKDDSYTSRKYNVTSIHSHTWAWQLVAKFMTSIGNTHIRGFANAGIDLTSRQDEIINTFRINPTFGIGINYLIQPRLMVEFGFQYVAGFGRCTEIPGTYYIPFLFSLTGKLFYRI